MRSPLEPKGALSALALVLLLVAVLTLGDAWSPEAAAEPRLGFDRPTIASIEEETISRRTTGPTVRFASHQEEDEEHDHGDEHEDHEDDEDDDEDLELEMLHVELERAALETYFGGLELVEKVANMATDDDAIAVLAVTTIGDEVGPEERLPLLEEIARDAPSKAARRVARLTLAETYGEQGRPEDALAQLRRLAMGED